ncbi:hypothetical protein SAMN02745729_11924 [Marinobacterium iners DSM 11526]|uniref:Uncharacterized protein n=1 Tax=Marinobacterium iners DSM 11526 TaxID=1122198 RepID=A0A1H4GQ97_9GAMM|nr:hypothetical protein SAMN02745729_11924 [Marinobacterium iners DSM 11526]
MPLHGCSPISFNPVELALEGKLSVHQITFIHSDMSLVMFTKERRARSRMGEKGGGEAGTSIFVAIHFLLKGFQGAAQIASY